MAGIAGLNPTLRNRLNATGTVDKTPKKGKSIQEYEEKQKLNVANNNASVARQASPDREIERTTLPFAKVGNDSWPNQGNKTLASKNGIDRFDPNKLTLGNSPDGKVGMFKDGQMLEPGSVRLSGGNLGGTPLPAGQSPFFIKSEAAKGLVPQPGTASAIPGMQQNPAVTTPGGNMTGIMNQETAMLSAAMGQGMKPGQYQDFSKSIGMNPSTPGGDAAFRSIEAQIADLTNMNKQLAGGYGQSTEMGGWSKTKRTNMIMQNTDQIRQLNDSLTGRSTLANDLVKALLTAQTGKETTAMTANAGTEQEKIKAGAAVQVGAMDAAATQGSNAYKQDVNAEHKNKTRQSVNLRAGIKSLEDEYAQNQDPSIKKKLEDLRAQLLTLEADDAGFFAAAPDAN